MYDYLKLLRVGQIKFKIERFQPALKEYLTKHKTTGSWEVMSLSLNPGDFENVLGGVMFSYYFNKTNGW